MIREGRHYYDVLYAWRKMTDEQRRKFLQEIGAAHIEHTPDLIPYVSREK